jgi:hypothetical protein
MWWTLLGVACAGGIGLVLHHSKITVKTWQYWVIMALLALIGFATQKAAVNKLLTELPEPESLSERLVYPET